MIRLAFVGAARVLFNLACVCFLLGLVCVYGAYRLVRAAMAGRGPQPVREAGFGALLAVVTLVQALKANAPELRGGDGGDADAA